MKKFLNTKIGNLIFNLIAMPTIALFGLGGLALIWASNKKNSGREDE